MSLPRARVAAVVGSIGLLGVAAGIAVALGRTRPPAHPVAALVPIETPEPAVRDAGLRDEGPRNHQPAAAAPVVDEGVPPPDGPPPPRREEPPCTLAELPSWWNLDEDAPRPSAAAFERARVRAEWLGMGGWQYSVSEAGSSGFDVDGAPVTILAEFESRHDSYVLFTVPGAGPDYAEFVNRTVVYLARVESEVDPDGVALDQEDGGVARRYRRVEARRLYDFALDPQEQQGLCETSVANELRVRDIDGDGEREVTAIFNHVASGIYPDSSEECGAVAFLMSDDLRIQARITREHRFVRFEAGGEVHHDRNTTWRLTDANGDGHADLHLVASMRYSDDFMGDSIGNGETAPEAHRRDAHRIEADCPYDPTLDAWRCTLEGAALGQSLFRNAATVRRPASP